MSKVSNPFSFVLLATTLVVSGIDVQRKAESRVLFLGRTPSA
jgi:hypothetical protein